MDGDTVLIIGLVAVFGVMLSFMRPWSLLSGGGSKIARTDESDAHLSFDERIAERMRELEKERGAPVASATPPQGFGRRQT